MSVNLEIPSPATAAVSRENSPPKAGHSAKSGDSFAGLLQAMVYKRPTSHSPGGNETGRSLQQQGPGPDGENGEQGGSPAIHLQVAFKPETPVFYGSSSGEQAEEGFSSGESGNNLLSQVSGGSSGEAALASAGSLEIEEILQLLAEDDGVPAALLKEGLDAEAVRAFWEVHPDLISSGPPEAKSGLFTGVQSEQHRSGVQRFLAYLSRMGFSSDVQAELFADHQAGISSASQTDPPVSLQPEAFFASLLEGEAGNKQQGWGSSSLNFPSFDLEISGLLNFLAAADPLETEEILQLLAEDNEVPAALLKEGLDAEAVRAFWEGHPDLISSGPAQAESGFSTGIQPEQHRSDVQRFLAYLSRMDSPSSVQAEPPVDHQAGLSSAGKTELPFQLQPETDFEVQTDSKGESLLESFPGTAEENEGGNRVRAILSTAAAVKEEAALVGEGIREAQPEGMADNLEESFLFVSDEDTDALLFTDRSAKTAAEGDVSSRLLSLTRGESQLYSREIVEQIFAEARYLTRPGGQELRLKLQPDFLGEVIVRIRRHKGVLSGEIITQHLAVKELLESQLETLRQRFQQFDLNVERFQVFVKDEGQQGFSFAKGYREDRPGSESDFAPFAGASSKDTVAAEAQNLHPGLRGEGRRVNYLV